MPDPSGFSFVGLWLTGESLKMASSHSTYPWLLLASATSQLGLLWFPLFAPTHCGPGAAFSHPGDDLWLLASSSLGLGFALAALRRAPSWSHLLALSLGVVPAFGLFAYVARLHFLYFGN